MHIILILISIFLLSDCSHTILWDPTRVQSLSRAAIFEVPHGFEMLYDPSPTLSIRDYSLYGSSVINGSYFGTTDTWDYSPAWLWRIWKNELSPAIFTDPNITHVVTISRSDRIQIDISANSILLTRKWGSEQDAFQAWPLVLSGNILQKFSGSWHADGLYARTLIGKT